MKEENLDMNEEENDVVLDPFLGVGTTMDACLRLKRSCIGIEINPEYIEKTKKRLNWGSSLSDKIEWDFKDMSGLKWQEEDK
jgi:DNA modification methylase